MKPTIGRTVIVRGSPAEFNGATEAPAIITRVWSKRDTRDGPVLVNLTVFADLVDPLMVASVHLFDSADEAAIYRGANPGSTVAFWPERVAATPA